MTYDVICTCPVKSQRADNRTAKDLSPNRTPATTAVLIDEDDIGVPTAKRLAAAIDPARGSANMADGRTTIDLPLPSNSLPTSPIRTPRTSLSPTRTEC